MWSLILFAVPSIASSLFVALSARRIEASSALRISRIGVAKAREGVAIGRNGIVHGELSFKIVNNREDRDSMSGDDPAER
jgi:hypothetical protein